jgi:hypothetical protein
MRRDRKEPNDGDTAIIRTIKDDWCGWPTAGSPPPRNRANLTRGGGLYIHAEKLRHTNAEAAVALARPGRYHSVADNLRVKEVHVNASGEASRGDEDGARTQRFVVCHNPEAAERDAAVRANLVTLWVPETLRTSRDLLVFVEEAAEAVVSFDLGDLGWRAVREWP